MFPLVREAVQAVLPVESLRFVGLSHFEADECGSLNEQATRTLLCGDLFTQGGAEHQPLTESDILGPSEAMRASLDYYTHASATRPTLERLAALGPETLACMHGSAWRGDGGALLRGLADSLEPSRESAAAFVATR